MKNSVKNIAVTFSFIIMVWGFLLVNIFIPDNEFSFSERRKLMLLPSFSSYKLLNGEMMDEFEEYFMDQFVLRDEFRGLKAMSKYYLFKQKDNNNVYVVDGIIEKMEHELDERSVLNAAKKLNEIYEKYLKGKNVAYAIIPDKSYYMAAQNGYLSIDYDRMLEIMNQNVENMKYIDLFQQLTLDDYYKTDIHWKQENIVKIADLLVKALGNDAFNKDYEQNKLYPFYGSYYGHAALKLQPDTLCYLTDNVIDNALVFDHESNSYGKIYSTELFDGMDSYNVFLSGPKPLLTIYNEECNNDKELLLFRDSFGSSIAPLMLQGYSKVTLIDIRYISTDLLDDYIDFSQNQDVLFLYNTRILNNSYMLK